MNTALIDQYLDEHVDDPAAWSPPPSTPEVWRAAPGWERLYEVSDAGRSRSLRTGAVRADVRVWRWTRRDGVEVDVRARLMFAATWPELAAPRRAA